MLRDASLRRLGIVRGYDEQPMCTDLGRGRSQLLGVFGIECPDAGNDPRPITNRIKYDA